MTTIIAVQTSTGAYMAADTQATEVSRRWRLSPDDYKIYNDQHYLIAGAGDIRALNIIKWLATPPEPPETSDIEHLTRFMARTFVPYLQNLYLEHKYPVELIQEKPDEYGIDMIVCVNGVVFSVDAEWGITQDQRGIYAQGSGSAYALGFLSSVKKFTQASLERAIEVAGDWDIGTGQEATVFYQKRLA